MKIGTLLVQTNELKIYHPFIFGFLSFFCFIQTHYIRVSHYYRNVALILI